MLGTTGTSIEIHARRRGHVFGFRLWLATAECYIPVNPPTEFNLKELREFLQVRRGLDLYNLLLTHLDELLAAARSRGTSRPDAEQELNGPWMAERDWKAA